LIGEQGELENGEGDHESMESTKDMSIAKFGVAVPDTGVSTWNKPYGSLSNAGLRGSIESMHVAGAS
jgi:hypothetical protein